VSTNAALCGRRESNPVNCFNVHSRRYNGPQLYTMHHIRFLLLFCPIFLWENIRLAREILK
jgi:hypothetical protein